MLENPIQGKQIEDIQQLLTSEFIRIFIALFNL